MKPILKLIPAVATLVLFGCKSGNDEKSNVEANIPLVSTVKVQEKSFNPKLSFTGTVFANKEANLGATLPGRVEKVFFEEGQSVRKGDLIVELSDEMLTQATIEYETIKKDFERVSRLREKGSISEMEYDHVKAKFEASKAKVEMVRKNTQVYAPFGGVIVERMMEEGEVYFINPGLDPGYSMRSGIVRLMQLDPVKVRFDVNEKDLQYVKKGLVAEITMDGIAGKTYIGKVVNIKPMLSTTTRSTTVEIQLSNTGLEIKPGMFANVVVNLPEIKASVIPLKTIYRQPGTSEDYVYMVKDEVVSRVRIKQLETLGDFVAVSGINAGVDIVLEGKNRVNNGLKVKVSNNN